MLPSLGLPGHYTTSDTFLSSPSSAWSHMSLRLVRSVRTEPALREVDLQRDKQRHGDSDVG